MPNNNLPLSFYLALLTYFCYAFSFGDSLKQNYRGNTQSSLLGKLLLPLGIGLQAFLLFGTLPYSFDFNLLISLTTLIGVAVFIMQENRYSLFALRPITTLAALVGLGLQTMLPHAVNGGLSQHEPTLLWLHIAPGVLAHVFSGLALAHLILMSLLERQLKSSSMAGEQSAVRSLVSRFLQNSPALLNMEKMLIEFTGLILDRKSTRLNSSHRNTSRMPSSA